jgi:hypothetical protein
MEDLMSSPESSTPPPNGEGRAENAPKIAKAYLEFESSGQLLANLESSERGYEANTQVAERAQAKHGSAVALSHRVQAAALRFRANPTPMPGIDSIELRHWPTNCMGQGILSLGDGCLSATIRLLTSPKA